MLIFLSTNATPPASHAALLEQQTHDPDYWKNEAVALLALSSVRGIGYWTLNKLGRSGQSYKELFKLPSRDEFEAVLKEHGCRGVRDLHEDWEEAQRRIWSEGNRLNKDLRMQGIRLILTDSPEFPPQLKQIDDPPQWLFYQAYCLNCFSYPGGRRQP